MVNFEEFHCSISSRINLLFLKTANKNGGEKIVSFSYFSQAQNLLEEARNENRMLEESVTMLKEQVNMFELEVEQIQEQAKIKESNFEEEIGMLKDQLKERNYQDVAENIELIRLQQDKKAKMTQLSTMKAQIQGFEEQVHKLKSEADKLKNENTEMSTAFAEEQRKSIHLTSELSNNSSSKQVYYITGLERVYKFFHQFFKL